MNRVGRTAIVVALAVALAAALAARHLARGRVASGQTPVAAQAGALPQLLDLGAGKCVPCRMMVPVLDGLKTEYAGRLDVRFVDVWQNPDEARRYGVRVIPTQIFFASGGRELFRHEGFFSRDEILAKWKELGVAL